MVLPELEPECPACGGAGGGPFGPPGSAWDVEDYVCPRCRGLGVLVALAPAAASEPRSVRPGIAKAPAATDAPAKRQSG